MRQLMQHTCVLNMQDLNTPDAGTIVMNPVTLTSLIDKLWTTQLLNLPNNPKLKLVIYWGERRLISPGRYSYGTMRTLGYVQTVDCSLASRDAYKKYILAKFASADDSYYSMDYNTFYISYGFIPTEHSDKISLSNVRTIDLMPIEEVVIDEVPRLLVSSS